MNQIQSTGQPIASATPDRMQPRTMPVDHNGALRQVGHAVPQDSGRQTPPETAERFDVLDGKLNQILIELTRLEESFRARPDPVFAMRETRHGLAALERKLDGVLLQLHGTRPSPANAASVFTNPALRMEQKTDGLLFGPQSQADVARVPQRLPESNGASVTHLHAIDGKLDQIMSQLTDRGAHLVAPMNVEYDHRQVAAIEDKLNRILITLSTAIAPAQKPATR